MKTRRLRIQLTFRKLLTNFKTFRVIGSDFLVGCFFLLKCDFFALCVNIGLDNNISTLGPEI